MAHEETSQSTYYRLARSVTAVSRFVYRGEPGNCSIYALAAAAARPILAYASGYAGPSGGWAAAWVIFRLLGSPLLLFVTGGALVAFEGRIHTVFGLPCILFGLSWVGYAFTQDF